MTSDVETQRRARGPASFSLRVLDLGLRWIFAAAFVGCTSFRGPNDLQVGTEYKSSTVGSAATAAPEDNTTLPAIVWSGERKIIRPAGSTKLKFDWPVDEARMTRGFLFGSRAHWGLDLAADRGTPILSAEKGTVIYTGNAFRGYGKLVVVEHDEEWATLYAHLDRITVKEGQTVDRGAVLGKMGRTGRASGVHLHFEVRQNRQPVNPLAFLPEYH